MKSNAFVLDNTPPTSTSVSINAGAASTLFTDVTLTLSATDTTTPMQMCISNTTSCSNWETYSGSKARTLTAGNGTKTVYVRYRDALGNTTSSYVSDNITLNADTTSPVC